MTWLEFKKELEQQGVTDEMTVGWIDVHCPEAPLDVAFGEVTVGTLADHPETLREFTVS
jgi:hypothetical protein